MLCPQAGLRALWGSGLQVIRMVSDHISPGRDHESGRLTLQDFPARNGSII